MSRLIDADEIKIRLPFKLPPYNMMLLRNSIRQGIQDTPTVDAELVRHRHWEAIERHTKDGVITLEYYCTECGVQLATSRKVIDAFRYCPFCGRKMDEEAEDE